MDNNRQHILTNYISYLYTTGRSYDTIGKHIKYVADFLESTEEVNRRGYLSYKRKNADVMARYPLMCSAICDLLSYLKIGYGRRKKTVKPLEKLDAISEKNKKMLNDFIVWLTDNNDYALGINVTLIKDDWKSRIKEEREDVYEEKEEFRSDIQGLITGDNHWDAFANRWTCDEGMDDICPAMFIQMLYICQQKGLID